MKAQKIMGIVGWKNSGKTTLVEALVREMTARGLRISTVKHAHHAFEIDVPGKDSYRHLEAGAHEVIVASYENEALPPCMLNSGSPKPALPRMYE